MRSYGTTNALPYAAAPAVGLAGDTYWNTTDKSLYISDGTAWNKVGPGTGGPPSGGASGDLSGSYPGPTVLKSAGNFTVGAQLLAITGADPVVWGPRTIKGRLSSAVGADYFEIGANRTLASVQDDNTKPSWFVRMRVDTDVCQIIRQAPAGGNVGLLTVDGATGKTTCTLADGTVTRAMVAAGAPIGNNAAAAVATNFSTTTYNAWVDVVSLPAITVRGGAVLLIANHGLVYNALSSTGIVVYQKWLRNGAAVWQGQDQGTKCGINGTCPLPWFAMVDFPGAGTHTYKVQVWQQSGASSSITQSGAGSVCAAVEVS